MKPVWFLQQREQDYDSNEQRLAYVVQEMGMAVHVEKYVPFGGMSYAFLPADQPVVFHGSIAVAKDVQRREDGRRLFPFGWFDWDRLACRTYYAHWGRFLLNREYGFIRSARWSAWRSSSTASMAATSVSSSGPTATTRTSSAR